MSRIFTTSFASVYPHYVAKVEKKGRTKEELDHVNRWLTGFGESALGEHSPTHRHARNTLPTRTATRMPR